MGWECPKCGAGNSPSAMQCPCVNTRIETAIYYEGLSPVKYPKVCPCKPPQERCSSLGCDS